VGDLLKQFSVLSKSNRKNLSPQMNAEQRWFGRLGGGPDPTCWQGFDVPKPRLTRVIAGENRSGAGDLLKQFAVLGSQQKQPQRLFAADERGATL